MLRQKLLKAQTLSDPARPRVLLIIPCFNEAGTIGSLLREVSETPYDSLVIDDGSKDDTAEISKEWTQCLSLPFNLGIGGAVQSGIKYAFRQNYDLCVQVDGDGQHPPEEITKLVSHWIKTQANLVIGSRFLSTEGFKSGFARRLGIQLISRCLFVLFKNSITDPTSGFRLMDRKAMQLFCEYYPADFPEPTSIALALGHGLNVQETSVIMRSRTDGTSSIYGWKSVSYIIRVLSQILQVRLGGIV